MSESSQIKSRQRVADHGEVFTAQREVNAMLDLVKQETERIESRFLEPACGDGNFLAEILWRKLEAAENRYRRKPSDFEKYSLLALSSIYGVELLADNVDLCRERLFEIWNISYTLRCRRSRLAEECRKAAKFLLSRNILCGDVLSLRADDGQPLVFSQWSLIGSQFKRTDYTLEGLLEVQPPKPDQVPLPRSQAAQQQSLLYKEPMVTQTSLLDVFEEAPAETVGTPPSLPTDEEGRLLKDFPLVDYWRIQHEY